MHQGLGRGVLWGTQLEKVGFKHGIEILAIQLFEIELGFHTAYVSRLLPCGEKRSGLIWRRSRIQHPVLLLGPLLGLLGLDGGSEGRERLTLPVVGKKVGWELVLVCD